MKIGTYALEQDYSHYVTRASEIVLAVVGTATKGPINEPTICTSPADFVNKFGKLNTNCYGTYAAYYFLNQASKLWFVRAAASTGVNAAVEATLNISGKDSEDSTVADALVLRAKSKGTYANGYSITIENIVTATSTFDMVLRTPEGVTLETTKNLNLSELDEDFETDYVKFVSKSANALVPTASSAYVFAGGNDGITGITATDYTSAGETLIPDTIDMNLFAIPGVSDASVINRMLQIAEIRSDCLYLVDPPTGLDTNDVADWHNAIGDYDDSSHTRLNSSYGALYYSWQRIYDSQNYVYVEIPPSVVVAPAIAKSVNISEIWYAPAGLKRGLIEGVVSPLVSPDSKSVDALYGDTNNVNCIVNDPQVGLCIFGQKTLNRSNSALNRVNVRLLLNYLKKIVVAACRHMTFEPNDRVTWNNFEDLVEPILQSIQLRRGIYEYSIVKGSAIVTDNDIDNYRMPCKILIRPTKSAEEIPIYFTITSTGADFNAVLGNDGIVTVK